MARTIWISGASSGIGAAFVDSAPEDGCRMIGISRRPRHGTEHLAADLADPASWRSIEESFARELAEPDVQRPVFFHCAGTNEGAGPMVAADPQAYAHGVICNAAAGQVLGRAFLASVLANGLGRGATLVMCSSPAAHKALPGLTNYCAGKAALELWAAAAAEVGDGEDAPRVFSVVPHAVDTPMMRAAMEQSAEELPISDLFREIDSRAGFATPGQAAAEVWKAIEDGVDQGAAVAVGAV